MKVVLGFHFRGDRGLRDRIFERTRPIVEGLFPFETSFVCDSGHERYNRSASRNAIIRYSMDIEADVVVVCDADSVPEREPLERSIAAAADGGIYTPFDRVGRFSSSFIKRKSLRLSRLRPFHVYGPSFGGCYVTTPQEWITYGGMDERIVGWGYEDQIFLVAANTFGRGHLLFPGMLYTFEHPRRTDSQFLAPNTRLRDDFNLFSGNKEKIRELQRGSNSFCPDEGSS